MDARQPFLARRTICLPRSALLRDGVTVRAIAASVHSGRLIRARRGWYVLPETPESVTRAVRVGGRATCITALREYGIWVPSEASSTGTGHPHVALPPTAARLRSPGDRTAPLAGRDRRGAVLHWRPWDMQHVELWRVSLVDALVHASWCVQGDDLVAIIESALAQRRIGDADLARIRARSPRARSQLFQGLDPRAGSGTETLVRLALIRAGLKIRSQVEIAGVGRVDLVAGDRVVVEVDSETWHGDEQARRRDYRRDLALYQLGYVVVRVSWYQAMFRREEVATAVLAAVATVRRR